MPIYEFRCGACGHRFEVLVQRRDEVAPGCPECGAPQTERVFSAFAVIRGAPPARCGSADCACRRH